MNGDSSGEVWLIAARSDILSGRVAGDRPHDQRLNEADSRNGCQYRHPEHGNYGGGYRHQDHCVWARGEDDGQCKNHYAVDHNRGGVDFHACIEFGVSQHNTTFIHKVNGTQYEMSRSTVASRRSW